ncbi:MAG: DUF3500 domain-containing protein, partial [SAR202 cluster bacterium]|nr:DUF3500 domain-containing protein [SAR202 cluster bacterium]
TTAQRAKANLSFQDETERRRFYYTPNEQGGLPLIEMQPTQQRLALGLVSSGLSETAFNVVSTIIGLENLLGRREGWRQTPYSGRAGDSRFRDPSLYYLTIFGDPDRHDGWGWRFGGHHVCVNYTLRGESVSATPILFGSHPAVAPMPGGRTLRPLAAEEDLGRELLLMLTPEQQRSAVISPAAPPDIVQSNRPRVLEGALPLPINTMMRREESPQELLKGLNGLDTPQFRAALGLTPELDTALAYSSTPKGLWARDMAPRQREAFMRLVHLSFDRLPEPLPTRHARAWDPDSTAFAWAGSFDVGGYHYYRIQGERILIEYDNTQGNANHLHSVWRDPVGDFGGDVLSQHYATAHRGRRS